MKRSLDEHAARFDEKAAEYDDTKSDEYRACASLVVDHAAPDRDDTVLDLGTGTGAIALPLAETAGRVIGRDISEGMLAEAREKAAERGLETVEFGEGRFRDPNVPDDADVDVVTTNFAMHHLSDAEKREAIDVIAGLEPRRIVLGDVMFFGEPDPSEPFYGPEVDDPATVGVLADAFTDAGYALTAVEPVHEQVGVLVAERVGDGERAPVGAEAEAGAAAESEPETESETETES
ncbi:class I SAM-dependent methyltransferase [Halosimplex salinum]|uniref:class I SAM-dependent methyltransferase n=1 Tax=Halosimplex salinum TaxID=1710538 RepID=UPI000F45F29D|nr:class I SAM-dependent methyltransferase [Halosimplex salinum]